MNLTNDFIIDFVGDISFRLAKDMRSAKFFTLSYIHPLLFGLIMFINLFVFVFCILIYRQTKRVNNKPAFIFIGAMAFIDLVLASSTVIQSVNRHEVNRHEVTEMQKADSCRWRYVRANITQSLHLCFLLALTLDRFISIKKPLRYSLIMTPCKVFLILLLMLLVVGVEAVFQYFSFELPAEDPRGLLCVWFHSFTVPFMLTKVLKFFVLLVLVLLVYGTMLRKFNQSRKRLDQLKQSMNEEDFLKSNLSFHQNIGPFKKDVQCEIPGVSEINIQPLQIKNLENGQTKAEMHRIRKRRPSSVVRGMTALLSQVHSARYILTIVLSFLITWAPIYMFILYECILQITNQDPVQEDSNANPIDILRCIKQSFENQECNIELDADPGQAAIGVKKIFHLIQANQTGFFLANFGSHFNSLLNPILYAFLYPDFRNYFANIPQWVKRRMSKKREKNKEIKLPVTTIRTTTTTLTTTTTNQPHHNQVLTSW